MNNGMRCEEMMIGVPESLDEAIRRYEDTIYEESSRNLLVGYSALRAMRKAIDAAKEPKGGYKSSFSECKSHLIAMAIEASMRSFYLIYNVYKV